MISFKEFLSESTIGKKIGGDHYVHKDYAHVLPQDELNKAKKSIPDGFKYNIIKHNKKEGTFSFIHSPDFDSAHEPTVGDSVKIHPDGSTKITKQTNPPKVYHHKHQWVAPDHKGFDVEESKRRSEEWKSVMDKDPNKKDHMTRIGSKTYWHSWLKDNNLKP